MTAAPYPAVSRRPAALLATATAWEGTTGRGDMAGPMTRGQVSGEAAAHRSLHLLVDEARALVEPVYRQAVDRLPVKMRQIAGYHAGWWDAEGQPVPHAGKAVRPTLTSPAHEPPAAAGKPRPGPGRRWNSSTTSRSCTTT